MVTANCGSILPQKVCSPYKSWEDIDQLSNYPQETQCKRRYYSYIINLLCVKTALRQKQWYNSPANNWLRTAQRLNYDRNFRKLTISLIDNIFEISFLLIRLRKYFNIFLHFVQFCTDRVLKHCVRMSGLKLFLLNTLLKLSSVNTKKL